MKENILKEVYECIKKCVSKKKYKNKIIMFLLGEKLSNEDKDVDAKYFSNILDGEVLPSKYILNVVATSNNWSIRRLCDSIGCSEQERRNIHNNLKAEISQIYTKHTLCKPEELVDRMIQKLVYKHFFGVTTAKGVFVTDKIIMSDNYAPWEVKETELNRQLSKNSLVFVTGEPSNGKTQLIRHFFADKIKTSNYVNLVWLNCENSEKPLKDYKIEISLVIEENPQKVVVEEFINKLQGVEHDTYIVIERPLLKMEDLEFLSGISIEKNIKIIIETRKDLSATKHHVVNIGRWPKKVLKEIYIKWRENNTGGDMYYRRLFHEVEYNPYMVELIAKNLKREHKTLNNVDIEYLNLIDKQGRSSYVHSKYRRDKHSENSLKAHILQVLEPYWTKDIAITEELTELSLWTRNAVSKEVLIEIAGIQDIRIQEALDVGFLTWESEEKQLLKMPKILAEAIWANKPIPYERYREIVWNSFALLQTKELPDGFSYVSMYETWEYMIKRMHIQVATIYSENRMQQKERFDEWTRILEILGECAERLGNIDTMNRIKSILNLRYKKDKETGEMIAKKVSNNIQELKKCIFDAKSYYNNRGDVSGTIEMIEKAHTESLSKCKSSLDEILLITFIVGEAWAWILEQRLQLYHSKTFLVYINEKEPSNREEILTLLSKTIEYYESVSFMATLPILLYYKMVYSYIRAIHGEDSLLVKAREYLKNFIAYADDSWRIRVSLQSQLYESLYIAYADRRGISFDVKHIVNFQIQEKEVFARCRTKETLELFCITGIWYYMFLCVKAGIQNQEACMNFLNKVEKIHAEQFSLDKNAKEEFIQNIKVVKESIENIT